MDFSYYVGYLVSDFFLLLLMIVCVTKCACALQIPAQELWFRVYEIG